MSPSKSEESDGRNEAYTDDGVLVFSLYLHNIPPEVTQDMVREYFAQFGELRCVNLIGKQRRRRFGFASFVDQSSAFRAYQVEDHYLQGQRIDVRLADSWHQPHAEEEVNIVRDDSDAFRIARLGGFNMLHLSDDSLEHLCRNMKLSSQIRFAHMCQRFRNVFDNFSKRAYKKFSISSLHSLTARDARIFFWLVGGHIEHLTAHTAFSGDGQILSSIRTFCKNLKYCDLFYCKMRPKSFKLVFTELNNLKKLWLGNCFLKDESIKALPLLESLEALNIPDNAELTGRYLSGIKRLKVLNLYGCRHIHSNHLIDLFLEVKGLKSLDIRDCEIIPLDVSVIMDIISNDLEVIKMPWRGLSYGFVAKLPRLKQFELLRPFGGNVRPTAVFEDLAEYKANQLECIKVWASNTLNAECIDLISQLRNLKTIDVPFNKAVNDIALQQFQNLENLQEINVRNCPDITNRGILGLLRSCKHIRCINIEGCNEISPDLILNAIKVLQPRKYALKTRVVMLVYGTLITENGLSQISEYDDDTKEYMLWFETTKVFPADADNYWELDKLDALAGDFALENWMNELDDSDDE